MRLSVIVAALIVASVLKGLASEPEKEGILAFVSDLYSIRDIAPYCEDFTGVEATRNFAISSISELEKAIFNADPVAAVKLFAKAQELSAKETQFIISKNGLYSSKRQPNVNTKENKSGATFPIPAPLNEKRNDYCSNLTTTADFKIQMTRTALLIQSPEFLRKRLKAFQ